MNKILILLSILTFGPLFSQIDNTIYPVDSSLYKTKTIKGTLKTIEWESKSMQELRNITIYEPVGFHKDSIYNVVIVTDNQAEALANALESKIISHEIKPLLIIGVNNREPQAIDSIYGKSKIDFRSSEMLGIQYVGSDEIDFSNQDLVKLLSNRVSKFCDFIAIEISNYITEHYNTTPKNTWTLGGFSNGGAIVVHISTTHPNSFGYIISMSPGGSLEERNNFDYSETKSKYFVCAGTNEKSFHKSSLKLVKVLKANGIEFEHKSFNTGHDYNMWLTYYVEVLSSVYKI